MSERPAFDPRGEERLALALAALFRRAIRYALDSLSRESSSRLSAFLQAHAGELEPHLARGIERGMEYGDRALAAVAEGARRTGGGAEWLAGFLREPSPASQRQAVVEFARKYSYNLIAGVNARDRRRVSEAIVDFYERGGTVPELARKLGDIYSPARARRIAQTEMVRAHTAGTAWRFGQAGVSWAHSVTVNDAHVCQRCLAEAQRIRAIDGRDALPPYHPNCRCVLLPVPVSRPALDREAFRDLRDLAARTPETPEGAGELRAAIMGKMPARALGRARKFRWARAPNAHLQGWLNVLAPLVRHDRPNFTIDIVPEIRARRVLGAYAPDTRRLLLAYEDDARTLWHEVGHWLEAHYPILQLQARGIRDMYAGTITQYARAGAPGAGPTEVTAEALELLFYAPHALIRDYPGLLAHLLSWQG